MKTLTKQMKELKLDVRTPKLKKNNKDLLWTQQLVDSHIAANLSSDADHLVAETPNIRLGKGLCVACKGAKSLCGKTRCPLVVRLKYYFRTMPLIRGTDIDGASPPSVFVGRIGYPHVYAGPLVPPIHEDTSLYDLPELWFGKSIDDIVGFRSMLVRAKHRVHVRRFEEGGKIMDRTRELALSTSPVDVELALKKRPQRQFVLDDAIQPFGPSALVQKMNIGTSRWNQHIEKAYGDIDLKATGAVTTLYRKGVLVTRIQRAFSVGAFGLKDNRRLVPTRWSITAVDSILSKDMMKQIKTFPEINEYRVYESRYLDNRFEVLLMPRAWSYEAMEAWYPGTAWNQDGRSIILFSDWEDYEGRNTYAKIGGCYYAARLAVGELLMKERRQATAIVLREAHPGYIMPVGVWQVRENVRNAMKQNPIKCDTLDEALSRITSQFQIPIQAWIKRSQLLQDALFQRKITEYFKQR